MRSVFGTTASNTPKQRTRHLLILLMTIIVNRHVLQEVAARSAFVSPARTARALSSTETGTASPLIFGSVLRAASEASSQEPEAPKRLVLIGGGHAHVQVIKALNKASRPDNLQVTLIDVQRSASYSGMVPGTIAGRYTPEETLLHLEPLARWAGIEFLHDRVIDVDIDNNLVHLQNQSAETERSPIPFDALSIDIGSASRGLLETTGAKKNTIPTRPIASLVHRLEAASAELRQNPRPVHVVVIGGGAAGLELSMSIKGRWESMLGSDGENSNSGNNIRVTVLDSGKSLLPNETPANRNALLRILEEKEIKLRHSCTVEEVAAKSVRLTSGESIPFSHCIWATGAGAHDLAYQMGKRGLSISDRGWIRVNENLQSVSHPCIFAAGDCCTIEGLSKGTKTPPKAGVYAVRSGPILIDNLTRMLDDKERQVVQLTPYRPQDDFLKLMVCGDGKALGFRFGIPIYGKWVFEMKDAIDNGFMDLFRAEHLPQLIEGQPYDTSQYDAVKEVRPPPLEPCDAAELLQRSDDDVDFEQAWNVLRDMNEDLDYRTKVLQLIPVPASQEVLLL